ncbi:hypothetical protein KO566_11710 [Flavobacteriaceae bacterium XHP0103]|uniref:hypothetical protein n=1 Tax=Marixanthotalea marina TaxID=2844359 RepID=UPI002989E279|nr:hypothetical protein [Marixanthotalea marina]MBU3822731.1 hypothetical protein [Marixanthotalea marina]
MKQLGLVITDGVGYRNFMLSKFLDEATNTFDTVFIYSGLPKTAFGVLPKNVEIRELPVFNEGKLTWFFRKWKEVAHMQKHKADYYGMAYNLAAGYPKNYRVRSILVKLIYYITYLVHSYKSILFIEKLQFFTFRNNKVTKKYIELLKKDNPTHLFFTHQRPPYLAPFLYAGIQLKIQVGSFIFSWDNLASKGRMLGPFDYFMVWSHLMAEELLKFYPNVKKENVNIVGTPQFEPYVMPKYELNKSDFFKKFGLDLNSKTICFSCADASIGKNDPLVISTIAKAIRNNKIKGSVQFLVRTSPAEGSERFEGVKKAFPEIIWNHPKWILTRSNHIEAWSQRITTVEDVIDLRAILEHVDLNVNMCSTMNLDFALFDKPVINTTFGNKTNGLYNDQRFLKYGHLKHLIEKGLICVAKNEEELITHINQVLDNPKQVWEKRKKLIDLQISKPLEGTSERMVDALLNLYD